VLKEQR
jgi:hypothetical protein